MSFWPFRTRRTSAPFKDDYSGQAVDLGGPIANFPNSVYIPNHLFIIPTSIVFSITNVAGIRNTLAGQLSFFRGGLCFSSIPFPPFIDNFDGYISFNAIGTDEIAAANLYSWSECLPYPLHLYPADRIYFTAPAAIAGDTVNRITIHGQTWEYY